MNRIYGSTIAFRRMIEDLKIDCVLDLRSPEDRRQLRDACLQVPGLSALIDEHLDDYVRFFQDPSWLTVYSGGSISVRTAPKHSAGFDIRRVLELTRLLKHLSGYQGYEKLVAGFDNPPQIESTYFEVLVATWCSERAVASSLEFSPEVTVKGGRKHPDFLWRTELGDTYCECKRGNIIESKFQQRVENLRAYMSEIYERHQPWDPSLRLDVKFDKGPLPQIQAGISSVVAQAAAALRAGNYEGLTFIEGSVTGALRPKGNLAPQGRETVTTGMAQVGPVAKSLPEVIYFTLNMSLAKYRQDAAARLLREAKTQLPATHPGAVFIELGGATTAQQKLLSLLGEPAYDNIPWVSIWAGGELLSAVWRNGQPFNDRLPRAR